ncbi:DUF6241 domain-containing protein [Bacillus sp. SCS-153A]|uniref:DUF6241 domain-containing protein n=1 Tax=Rossellomorea sedimentorum TaxID=3115294 RepID=UPI003906C2FB
MSLKWIGFISVFLVAGILGFIFWYEVSQSSSEDGNEETEYYEAGAGQDDSNSIREDEIPNTLSEEDLQQKIHDMSHQKVKATPKWGSLEITPERIDHLINVVEQGNYKQSHVYLDILYGWKEGDFSEADEDHNTIWRLQGGTIGKATGVLSVAEEQKYIEKHFQ